MILRTNDRSKTNLLEFEELTDLELESVAGGGKKERRAKRKRRRKRMWKKIKNWWLGLSREKLPTYQPNNDKSDDWIFH